MIRLAFIAAILPVAGMSIAVGQDALVFPNGDRLSGQLVAEEKEFYHFESEVLGRITVPVENAELVRGAPEDRAEEVEISSPQDSEAVGGVLVTPSPDGVPLRRAPWTGRFDMGYTWQSGRTEKDELSLRGQGDRRIDDADYRLFGEFVYGEAEGTRNTHRYLASFRWRESLSDRTFFESTTRYEADRVRDVRNRIEQNVGLGYRFLRSERVEASVVPGFTLQYTDEAGADDRWDYLASILQELVWRFSTRYRLEQDFNLLMDPAETDDVTLRFNAGIVGTVRQSINLSVRYHYLFENQTRPGLERTDQRLITSVGYAF